MKDDSRESVRSGSKLRGILAFLLLSPPVCALIMGVAAAVFIFISYLIDPQSVTIGSGPAPGGVALLAFLMWGFAGFLAGLVLGVLGAIVVAIRR